MRTFKHSKATDHLGRYYTESFISRLLVNCLPTQQSGSLLDLGAGEGSLSLAASGRWPKLDLVTVDVDERASQVLTSKLRCFGFTGKHQHVQYDALGINLKQYLNHDLQLQPILAVCNPPFQIPRWRKGFGEIIEDAGFSSSLPAISTIDAALLFLSQNLRLLRSGGTLGIIVPDSLVSAMKYLRFRKTLLEKYDLKRVIRLPRGCFGGTDALAYILILSKSRPSSDKVVLSTLSSKELFDLSVDRTKGAERLDYQYHVAERITCKATALLSSITLDLCRGSFNSAEVRNSHLFILHTTDITSQMRGIWFDFTTMKNDYAVTPCTVAGPGDILIARVGRNIGDKLIGVSHGYVAISDCIFRLRVQPEHQMIAMQTLSSATGMEWLRCHAYGVAARHLNKADLLKLPLEIV